MKDEREQAVVQAEQTQELEKSDLEIAVRALVDKIDFVVNSEEYQHVFVSSYVHNHPYQGPNFGAELKVVKELLKI